ncbi:MAG: ADP-ribosylglycohydrolase family protein [Candidatus Woesearchaeota archaeon]
MMLELAIGDAYGSGFEFAEKGFIRKNNNLKSYYKHRKCNILPGCYTDDAQMSIAIAELLMGEKEWDCFKIASKFVEAFKRDEREGYSSGFYLLLKCVNDGAELIARLNPNSRKNGAAMRACPIGILPDLEKVKLYAAMQAEVTHDSHEGITSAMASALMPHYFTYKLGKKKDLGEFIAGNVEGDWGKAWKGEVSTNAEEAVRAAITAIARGASLSSILKRSIAFGGDVDTVATIAMAAASCCDEVRKDIPKNLVDGLENGDYGKGYLLGLDKDLFKLRV